MESKESESEAETSKFGMEREGQPRGERQKNGRKPQKRLALKLVDSTPFSRFSHRPFSGVGVRDRRPYNGIVVRLCGPARSRR